MAKVNTKWFQDQVQELGISQRTLARELDLDPAAVSLMFQGKRKMTLEEASTLARRFAKPLDEVLRAAGIQSGSAKVVGWIDGELVVHKGAVSGVAAVTPPGGLGSNLLAFVFRTRGSPLESLDGAVAFVKTGGSDLVAALGRFSVIEVAKGKMMAGVLKRDSSGQHLITDFAGSTVMRDLKIKSAAVVIWLKM